MKTPPYMYRAHVTRVYDGDTITVDIDLGLRTWRKGETLRLFGLNAPEVRGDEREDGLVSRNYLRALILDKEVMIATLKDKTGKYGRWLATVYLDGIDINRLMVDDGMAQWKTY